MRMKTSIVLVSVAAGLAAAVVVLFLAVVWFGDSPALDDGALPRQVREANSCGVEQSGAKSGAIFDTQTMTVAAWILGTREGAFAGWTKQLRDGQRMSAADGMAEWLTQSEKQVVETDASAARMAATLRVKRPPPFAFARTGTTIEDFRTFIESATQPTARGLAETYSPRLCAVYKTGAYFGFSTLFRAASLKARNIFAAELKFYGKRLDMPNDLVRSMVEPGRTELNSDQILAADEQLSREIAEYWNTQ